MTLTYNLRQWITELESVKGSANKTALLNVVKKNKANYHVYLWEEAELALDSVQEYNIPEFKKPLKEAVLQNETIAIYLNGERPWVDINLDATAGRLDDYIQAVETARASLSKGNSTILQASMYWKHIIYRQAREDANIPQRRTKGQRGRTPGRKAEGKALYKATITERLQAMGTLAPFWSLIDKGNASAPMSRGGIPYPLNSPTNFVSSARSRIYEDVSEKYVVEQERVFARLERENYGENGILNQIVEAVNTFFEAPVQSWQPGKVLVELKINDRDYEVYITETRKLGLKLI